jgi:hypothetical protein
MPKDEFERLERRWRERPLFHEPPRRLPVRLLVAVVLAIAVLLGLSAVGLPDADRLLDGLTVVHPEPPAEQTAQTTATRVALPPIRH